MAGELKIVSRDGTTYWFGRDDRFPDEVRVYGADTRHWQYMLTPEARHIVREELDRGAEVQQGDPVQFFQPSGEDVGD